MSEFLMMLLKVISDFHVTTSRLLVWCHQCRGPLEHSNKWALVAPDPTVFLAGIQRHNPKPQMSGLVRRMTEKQGAPYPNIETL